MSRAQPGAAIRRERAPAKVNLLLHVGARRADGLHELCSLFASLELADEVVVRRSPVERDSVATPGVEGDDLCVRAVAAYRGVAGVRALPPVEVTVDKRIPIAAGLGGGSADAAATLRGLDSLADRPLGRDALRRIGVGLGADVPSQVEPGHALVSGAGEVVESVELAPIAMVLVPQERGLATADVYAEADRLGVTRQRLDRAEVRAAAGMPFEELARCVENDLQVAAMSLRPELAEPIAALERFGAVRAFVTGSGPTVVGLFADAPAARSAAAHLPDAIVTRTAR